MSEARASGPTRRGDGPHDDPRDGADRILAEIVGNAYHFDPADLEAMGVVGGQLQSLMRARAFEELEAECGLKKGPSPFQLMHYLSS